MRRPARTSEHRSESLVSGLRARVLLAGARAFAYPRPMAERAVPPPGISPRDFFTRWIIDSVTGDPERAQRLTETDATLLFELVGDEGGLYTVVIEAGSVRGLVGGDGDVDLHVRIDVETWRLLNSGGLSAPLAFLQRRVQLRGNLALAVKLHLILG